MRFLLLSLTLTVCALAQQASTTSLIGRVMDSAGAAIPNATVKAVEERTQETLTRTTNGAGLYFFELVRIGTYTITATANGFGAMTRSGVVVETNQLVRTNFELKVGQVTERIVVLGTPPPIATDEASLSEVLNQRAVANLPLNGRDVLRMASLAPGVLPGMKSRTGATAAGGEDFIGPGAREVQNSISLDGVSVVSNLINLTSLRPSTDAVEEFQIQTGTYSAQYGTMMGVHLDVITKSGTNELHGAVWEFLRNDKLDARDFFLPATSAKPPLRQNQFGGELGGPVFIPKLYNGRNKTFFLADYEGERQTQATTALAAVFPNAYRSGDLSAIKTPIKDAFGSGNPFPNNVIPASLLATQALKTLAYMPTANLAGAAANNYVAQIGGGNNTDQTLDKVDENLGDKAHLFFRYAYQKAALIQGSSNPINGFNVPLTDRNYAVGYTQTISPRMVNDLRFGYHKSLYSSVNFFTSDGLAGAGTALGIPGFTSSLANPGIPDFEITGFVAVGGQNMTSSNWTRPDSTFVFTDVLNYTVGAHSIATGAEFYRLTTGSQGQNASRGLFNFTGGISGNAGPIFCWGCL